MRSPDSASVVAVPPAEAIGALLLHSHAVPGGRVRKGSRVDASIVRRLVEAGLERVLVFRQACDEAHEDAAADRLARELVGPGLSCRPARTGRADVHADADGLLGVDARAVTALNAVSPGIAVSTLAPMSWVSAGERVATMKIVPFALPHTLLASATAALDGAGMELHRARGRRVTVLLAGLKGRDAPDALPEAVRERLRVRGMDVIETLGCDHTPDDLARAFKSVAHGARPDILLVVPRASVVDREDVVPRALARAGGTVVRHGMAMEPGNLLLYGRLGRAHVVVQPGCARSSSGNGLDRVLDRLACGLELDGAWWAGLGVGGLLAGRRER